MLCNVLEVVLAVYLQHCRSCPRCCPAPVCTTLLLSSHRSFLSFCASPCPHCRSSGKHVAQQLRGSELIYWEILSFFVSCFARLFVLQWMFLAFSSFPSGQRPFLDYLFTEQGGNFNRFGDKILRQHGGLEWEF